MNRNFWKTFRKAYPLIYRPVWRENLLLSFVDIFHGLSFALVVILTQRFSTASLPVRTGQEAGTK